MTEQDQERGLYDKYIIQHSDGSPVDPTAKYFVLRYDGPSFWAWACRAALFTLARLLRLTYPQLSEDIQIALKEESGKAGEIHQFKTKE